MAMIGRPILVKVDGDGDSERFVVLHGDPKVEQSSYLWTTTGPLSVEQAKEIITAAGHPDPEKVIDAARESFRKQSLNAS